MKNEPDKSPFPKSEERCKHEGTNFCTDNGWYFDELGIIHCWPVKSLTDKLFTDNEKLRTAEDIEVLNYSQEMQEAQGRDINFDEINFLVIHEAESHSDQTKITIPSKIDAYLRN